MRQDWTFRLAALSLCGIFLLGLCILGGAGWPIDSNADHLDLANPDVDPVEHAGEHVETGGVVVETDLVVIVIEGDHDVEYLLIDNAPDVEKGERLTVDGTLTEAGTLEANRDRAVTREPWEVRYMYAISVVGVLIVAVVGVDSWRLDHRSLSVEPRARPLHRTLFEEDETNG